MGYNVVTICKRHMRYNYSMRGEEFLDFQTIMRSQHRDCMKDGLVLVICDADTDAPSDTSPYLPMWPYEDRPSDNSIEHTLTVMKQFGQ